MISLQVVEDRHSRASSSSDTLPPSTGKGVLMKGRRMSRSASKKSFSKATGTHRFNVNGHTERGGIRL